MCEMSQVKPEAVLPSTTRSTRSRFFHLENDRFSFTVPPTIGTRSADGLVELRREYRILGAVVLWTPLTRGPGLHILLIP